MHLPGPKLAKRKECVPRFVWPFVATPFNIASSFPIDGVRALKLLIEPPSTLWDSKSTFRREILLLILRDIVYLGSLSTFYHDQNWNKIQVSIDIKNDESLFDLPSYQIQ